MKLRKVKWESHHILGNLELDFTNKDINSPYDIIVIAGENGIGKTVLLETIYNFLNKGSIFSFAFIEYQIGGDIYRAVKPEGDAINIDGFFDIVNLSSNVKDYIRHNRNNDPLKIKTTINDPRHYGCAYTKARSNYTSKRITTITAKDLDEDIYNNEEDNDSTSLKQLIVDIQAQDNSELSRMLKKDPSIKMSWSEFEKNSKIYRFSSAFNTFFENKLKYDRVESGNGSHEIIFKKNDKDINIDTLSTGERQIVFRGTYLLKNSAKLDGGIIFIDEPELSMHPSWQKKILSYYKGLFTKDGCQKSQILVATHSEGVIAEALKDTKAKILVLKIDKSTHVYPADIQVPLVLKNMSSAEINYQAFGVVSTDYHNALYGYIDAEGWMEEYKQGKKNFSYTCILKDGSQKQKCLCMSERIRHIIHHPENPYNSYQEKDLQESIETMREYILKKQQEVAGSSQVK